LRWAGVQPKRLNWPVISVGNLSTGGTGKTPFTIALVSLLTEAGLQVDVLSRGYGRTGSAVERVDPNGNAEQFGDEPLQIARAFGVPVYVGAKRLAAGVFAEQAASVPGVHLLDDGFQHRQLARDIDIVLLNSEDLTDRLLPAGNLREAPGALRRASILAVPAEDDAALARIQLLGLRQPIWRFRREMTIPATAEPVLAFCGIARPQQFFAGLERAGIQLAARQAFPDHHRFTPASIAQLSSLLHKSGAASFVTTEKDLVRLGPLAAELRQAAPLAAAGLRLFIEDRAAVSAWLLGKLASLRPDSVL
jgi:tetraacyldisaccharide 4'-kinase